MLHNPGDRTLVDLSWTGSASSFEIFRASTADAVPTPPNSLTVTPFCAHTDAPPGTPDIIYYMVLNEGS